MIDLCLLIKHLYITDRPPFWCIIIDNILTAHEELENIKAVIRHIEKETCIEFRDLTKYDEIEGEEDTTEEDQESEVETETEPYGNTYKGQEKSDATGTENDAVLAESKEESSSSEDGEDGLRKGKKGKVNKIQNKDNRVVGGSDSDRLHEAVSLKIAKKFVRKKKSIHAKSKRTAFLVIHLFPLIV